MAKVWLRESRDMSNGWEELWGGGGDYYPNYVIVNKPNWSRLGRFNHYHYWGCGVLRGDKSKYWPRCFDRMQNADSMAMSFFRYIWFTLEDRGIKEKGHTEPLTEEEWDKYSKMYYRDWRRWLKMRLTSGYHGGGKRK